MLSPSVRRAYPQESGPKPMQIEPARNVRILYGRVLFHIEKAEAAVREHNHQKKHGHLGKAIGIITELYSSVDQKDESEEAHFFRNVYSTILIDLFKVADSNDIHIFRKPCDYLERLKKIWEEASL